MAKSDFFSYTCFYFELNEKQWPLLYASISVSIGKQVKLPYIFDDLMSNNSILHSHLLHPT